MANTVARRHERDSRPERPQIHGETLIGRPRRRSASGEPHVRSESAGLGQKLPGEILNMDHPAQPEQVAYGPHSEQTGGAEPQQA